LTLRQGINHDSGRETAQEGRYELPTTNSSCRVLPVKTRIGIRIDEKRYKPDLDLLDRYLAYSAELLRLALLGLAGYGFLLKELVYSSTPRTDFTDRLFHSRWILICGVICLGVSAALALQHRIFATDSLACIIDHLRHRAVRNEAGADRQIRECRFNMRWSARFLQLSALFLSLGAGAVVITFALVLWKWN
jgi:hypothetical protein